MRLNLCQFGQKIDSFEKLIWVYITTQPFTSDVDLNTLLHLSSLSLYSFVHLDYTMISAS